MPDLPALRCQMAVEEGVDLAALEHMVGTRFGSTTTTTVCDWVHPPPQRCGDEVRSIDEDLDEGCRCNEMNHYYTNFNRGGQNRLTEAGITFASNYRS